MDFILGAFFFLSKRFFTISLNVCEDFVAEDLVRLIRRPARKATFSFVTYCLSEWKQFGFRWTDFHEILFLSIFSKTCRENSFFTKIWQEQQVHYMKTNSSQKEKCCKQYLKRKSKQTFCDQ